MTDQSIFNNDEQSTPADVSKSGNEQATAADQLISDRAKSDGKPK